MSGEDIPYQLRPNKFIDRQAFIDLLCRIVPGVGADRYVYLSMGGRHLIDHVAVYRHVGITRLFSFDKSGHVVGRQRFNRPIDKAICDEMAASGLPAKIDAIGDLFPGATNVVVWLDYTAPKDRLTQLQELVEVAKRLQPGLLICRDLIPYEFQSLMAGQEIRIHLPEDRRLWPHPYYVTRHRDTFNAKAGYNQVRTALVG